MLVIGNREKVREMNKLWEARGSRTAFKLRQEKYDP